MRFLAYLRSNAIAIVALVIAMSGGAAYAVNTIRSSDIVDGQVKNADLGANAVTSNKIADNSVTGSDVKESTLGVVPSAAAAWNSLALGGNPASAYRTGAWTYTQRLDQCAQTGVWKLCAPISLYVPPNKQFNIQVTTSGSAWGSVLGHGLFCAAFDGPTCLTSPTGATFVPGHYTTLSDTGAGVFGPGTHYFGMALRADVAVGSADTARITTTIQYFDAALEVPPGT